MARRWNSGYFGFYAVIGKILFDSQTTQLMTLVCVFVCLSLGRAQKETLLRAEHAPLPLPCWLGSADYEGGEGRRGDEHVCACAVVFARIPRRVPLPLNHATNTSRTSQREASAVMVTAESDLQRLLMLPRAASYSAWHGLCESSATFKFTCSPSLWRFGLIKMDEQMGKMMEMATTKLMAV